MVSRYYNKEYAATYYIKNKAAIQARNARWQSQNKEKLRSYVAKYKTTIKYEEHINKNYWQGKLKDAKRRATQLNVPFNLTLEDIPKETHCKYLNIPLRITVNEGQVMDCPSLDRIIPELGYVKGNVQIISKLANTMKNCATEEQLKTFATNVLKLHSLT